MTHRTVSTCWVVLFVPAAYAFPQQDAPRLAESGKRVSSLEATMKSIENDLSSIGEVKFTEYIHDDGTGQNLTTGLTTAQISVVGATASNCRIEYRSRLERNFTIGPSVIETAPAIWLRDYDYEFFVTRLDRELDATSARGGHSGYKHRVEPLVYVLNVASPSDGALNHRFWFYEEEMANRVAFALRQAAKVCGEERRSRQTQTGSLSDVTRIASESIARVMLAAQHPRIQSRIPGLKCISITSEMSQRYQSGATVTGENVTIRCDQNGHQLAEASWSAKFPYSIRAFGAGSFVWAEVASEEVLVELFSLSAFRQDDLAELALSPIPEVRIGVAANLTDQASLAKLGDDAVPSVRKAAVNKLKDPAMLSEKIAAGKDLSVRQAAVRNLTDQTVLAKLATQNVDRDIRIAAVGRLNDQAALAAVATGDNEWTVRMAAVRKINDQWLLAKIATGDRDGTVRQSAVKQLNDQALLAKLATEHPDPGTRSAATERLSDQTVLGKMAIEDRDWLVRLAAVNNLTDQAVLAKVAEEDKEPRVRKVALEKRAQRP